MSLLSIESPADAARPRLVYRVDRVTAMIVKRKLIVEASGAVDTGGWQHPRLHLKPSAPEARVMQFEFIANPPSPRQMVIQALLPVHAKQVLGLPHYGTTAVSVTSQTNGITTQISP